MTDYYYFGILLVDCALYATCGYFFGKRQGFKQGLDKGRQIFNEVLDEQIEGSMRRVLDALGHPDAEIHRVQPFVPPEQQPTKH